MSEYSAAWMRPLAPMSAEFGLPHWVFGLFAYAFAGQDRIVAAFIEDGLAQLGLIDFHSGKLERLDVPFTRIVSVRTDGGDRVVFCGGDSDKPGSVVLLDLGSRSHKILKQSFAVANDPAINKYFTKVQPVAFP